MFVILLQLFVLKYVDSIPPPVFFMPINKVTSAIVHGCENITGLNILVGETLSPECQKS